MGGIPIMSVTQKDKDILRKLGKRLAEIGNLPVQKETAELWRKLNRLEPTRPLVWINEICWHEMNVDDELTPLTTDPYLQGIEAGIRRTLYQWDHLRADMVVDPVVYCGYVFSNTGYGFDVQSGAEVYDAQALHYDAGIKTEKDVEKINIPVITPDWDATERNFVMLSEIFDDVIDVWKRGVVTWWGAPWDVLVRLYGIEQLYMDMIDKPELVHMAIGRMMDAMLSELDQLEQHGLLSMSNGNHRVGAGGLGITDELPPDDFDPAHVRWKDLWGNSTGQIFSEVSPAMHDEFCLQHEMRMLKKFGLNCYGCCEPLHKKIDLMRTIPNLRRISMSPWIDIDEAAADIGADYVFSSKPNPAVLATTHWRPEQARKDLKEVLEKTRQCRVELIMKDISTVCSEPRRLWEWSQIATDMAKEYGE